MLAYIIILLVVVFDQLTKFWVIRNFSMFESREIIPGFFNLIYITNPGAAFGLLSGNHGGWRHVFFVTVAVVAIGVMVAALKQFRNEGKIFIVAIGLIAGGAVGNLVDRLRLGEVVDFLDFYVKGYHWPAFNVADSSITIGVGMFLVGNFFFTKKHH